MDTDELIALNERTIAALQEQTEQLRALGNGAKPEPSIIVPDDRELLPIEPEPVPPPQLRGLPVLKLSDQERRRLFNNAYGTLTTARNKHHTLQFAVEIWVYVFGSQAEAARRLDINKTHLSRMLKGKKGASPETLAKLRIVENPNHFYFRRGLR